jgi:hypothetical protein
MPENKPLIHVKLELTVDEVNTVMEALARQPFKDVYKIIEKIHLQAKTKSEQVPQKSK